MMGDTAAEVRRGGPQEVKAGDSDAWAANQLLSLLGMAGPPKGAEMGEGEGGSALPKGQRAAGGKPAREGAGTRKGKKLGADGDDTPPKGREDGKRKKEPVGGRRVNRPTHNHSKESKAVLRGWFYRNLDNPYPSEDLKRFFAQQTGLNQAQIATFFTNERKRYPNPPWWDRSKTTLVGRFSKEAQGEQTQALHGEEQAAVILAGVAMRKGAGGSASGGESSSGGGDEYRLGGGHRSEATQPTGASSPCSVPGEAREAREGVESILNAAGLAGLVESRLESVAKSEELATSSKGTAAGEGLEETGKVRLPRPFPRARTRRLMGLYAQGKRVKKRPRTDDELDGGPAYHASAPPQFEIKTNGRGGRWEEEGSGPRSSGKGKKPPPKRVALAQASPVSVDDGPPAKPWVTPVLPVQVQGTAPKPPAPAGEGNTAGDASAVAVLMTAAAKSPEAAGIPTASSILAREPETTSGGVSAAEVKLQEEKDGLCSLPEAPCVLCGEGLKTWCIMPCGHKALCEQCAHAFFETVPRPFDHCPTCRWARPSPSPKHTAPRATPAHAVGDARSKERRAEFSACGRESLVAQHWRRDGCSVHSSMVIAFAVFVGLQPLLALTRGVSMGRHLFWLSDRLGLEGDVWSCPYVQN